MLRSLTTRVIELMEGPGSVSRHRQKSVSRNGRERHLDNRQGVTVQSGYLLPCLGVPQDDSCVVWFCGLQTLGKHYI